MTRNMTDPGTFKTRHPEERYPNEPSWNFALLAFGLGAIVCLASALVFIF